MFPFMQTLPGCTLGLLIGGGVQKPSSNADKDDDLTAQMDKSEQIARDGMGTIIIATPGKLLDALEGSRLCGYSLFVLLLWLRIQTNKQKAADDQQHRRRR